MPVKIDWATKWRTDRQLKHLQPLVGEVVTSLFLAGKYKDILVFKFQDGETHALCTDGDCCSETWWADITGFDALIGTPIYSAEFIDLPEPQDGRSRQDYDQAYGIVIKTAKGTCDIVYRNSSNGYYGGSCELLDKPVDLTDAVEITDDWSA